MPSAENTADMAGVEPKKIVVVGLGMVGISFMYVIPPSPPSLTIPNNPPPPHHQRPKHTRS